MSGNKLEVTYFKCPKCSDWTTVEAKGVVIAGPYCKRCKVPMRPARMQQLNLGLYSDKDR